MTQWPTRLDWDLPLQDYIEDVEWDLNHHLQGMPYALSPGRKQGLWAIRRIWVMLRVWIRRLNTGARALELRRRRATTRLDLIRANFPPDVNDIIHGFMMTRF